MGEQLDIFPELKELEELKERVRLLEEGVAELRQSKWFEQQNPTHFQVPKKVTTDKLLPVLPVDTPRPYYYTTPPADWFKPPFQITGNL